MISAFGTQPCYNNGRGEGISDMNLEGVSTAFYARPVPTVEAMRGPMFAVRCTYKSKPDTKWDRLLTTCAFVPYVPCPPEQVSPDFAIEI